MEDLGFCFSAQILTNDRPTHMRPIEKAAAFKAGFISLDDVRQTSYNNVTFNHLRLVEVRSPTGNRHPPPLLKDRKVFHAYRLGLLPCPLCGVAIVEFAHGFLLRCSDE
jgi:hypothetical protein